MKESKKQAVLEILEFLQHHPGSSSSEVYDGIGSRVSYATLKRMLKQLIEENMISVSGQRKGARYRLSQSYELIRPVDIDEYFSREVDERHVSSYFALDLLREVMSAESLFRQEELQYLLGLQNQFMEKSGALPDSAYKSEMERLAIDLSWKSSQIEGNTYSLLETERLLREQQTAAGKTRDEATMLLNHKSAIDFLLEHPDFGMPLNIASIEDLHHILVKDLNVSRNIRNHRVGISGTNYTPPENEFQIREALEEMCTLINRSDNVCKKALLALLLISYIQPFADGNKRTARMVCNAVLLHHHYCPLSFRTVDPIEYKKALLIFYEINNINPFKRMFVEQFEFAVKTYF